jgi:hypothetical protein
MSIKSNNGIAALLSETNRLFHGVWLHAYSRQIPEFTQLL